VDFVCKAPHLSFQEYESQILKNRIADLSHKSEPGRDLWSNGPTRCARRR
jgi:hypothetical protein